MEPVKDRGAAWSIMLLTQPQPFLLLGAVLAMARQNDLLLTLCSVGVVAFALFAAGYARKSKFEGWRVVEAVSVGNPIALILLFIFARDILAREFQ